MVGDIRTVEGLWMYDKTTVTPNYNWVHEKTITYYFIQCKPSRRIESLSYKSSLVSCHNVLVRTLLSVNLRSVWFFELLTIGCTVSLPVPHPSTVGVCRGRFT